MLNNPVINRPARATLEKIAAVADGGVTYRMLLASLNRDPNAAIQDPAALKRAQEDFETESLRGVHDRETFERIARGCFSALAVFVKEKSTPGLALPVPDLASLMEDMLKEFRAMPGHASFNIAYEIGKILNYYGHHFKDHAARCATVILSIADCLYAAQSEIILYFTPIGNRLIIQGMDMSAEAVYDIWGVDPYAMERLMETHTQEEALDLAFLEPFTLTVCDQKRNSSGAACSEKEFLDSVFGARYRFPQVRYGTGFYLEHVPESLADFARDHKSAVLENCGDETDAAQIAKLLDDMSLTPEQLAEELDRMEYTDGYSDRPGWRAMVAAVMCAETSFPFAWFQKEEPENEKEKADPAFRQMADQSLHAILLTDTVRQKRGIAKDTLLSVLSRYAQELGVPAFGDLFHYGVQVVNALPKTYRTPSKDDRAEPAPDTDAPAEETEGIPKGFLPWPDHRPEETGIYRTVLKDGRVLECLYLEKRHDWIRFHMCWNHMVEAFDPEPVKK